MLIGVIGSGSWGVALAQVLSDNKQDVIIWGRSEETVKEINENQHLKYFPDVTLSKNLKATTNFAELSECDIIILATPTTAIDAMLTKINQQLNKQVIIVNVSKGFHAKTSERLSVAIKRILDPERLKAVVSLIGPTHAEEVIIRLETAIVAVSDDEESSKIIQTLFANDYFRVYTSNDVVGAEIGAAVKNIIALASGIISGVGLGDNAKAALITRGLVEIARLGTKMGANPETFFGLTGVGDLIVTATSHHSRNYQAGLTIGKKGAKYFHKHNTKTVEGVKAVKEVMNLAKEYDVSMPISTEIYNVLYKDETVSDAINKLMLRDLKSEIVKE